MGYAQSTWTVSYGYKLAHSTLIQDFIVDSVSSQASAGFTTYTMTTQVNLLFTQFYKSGSMTCRRHHMHDRPRHARLREKKRNEKCATFHDKSSTCPSKESISWPDNSYECSPQETTKICLRNAQSYIREWQIIQIGTARAKRLPPTP